MKNIRIYPVVLFNMLMFAVVLPAFAIAQNKLSGEVTSEISGEKIQGAVVTIENSFATAVTDAKGKFTIRNLKNATVRIFVSHIAYENYSADARLSESPVIIRLNPRVILADEVNITATRAGDKSAVAYTNVSKDEIEKQNLGQDLPYLISLTPSVVVTSDAGAGVGYTGIRIRGSDATRVNVTINGIPVNDAEAHQVYWVDLPDFASSIDNIQVQRGIGTSTNGAGAFGGSVNIQSSKISVEPFASVNSSCGSFHTMKNTVQFGTGLLHNKFCFDGRLSKITSDGYVDRATSDLKSFYLSGGYYGNKSSLRLVIFSGKEKTYQAWYGVPEEKLKGTTEALLNHYYTNLGYLYFTPEDSINLFNSGNRTYNYYSYRNQTDNYQQDYYQLHYSYAPGEHLNLNAALHYTKGKGYYEEFAQQQSFSNYGSENVIIGNDTITKTDLVRQKWLDNDFYGITFSGNYEKNGLQLTVGGGYNTYDGDHFGNVTWSAISNTSFLNQPYYFDNALKHDFNVFGKLVYSVNSKLDVLCDLQYRTVNYSFAGIDEHMNPAPQHVDLNFFNPKAGLNYDINAAHKLYASVASGHKEPVRDDYVGYTPSNRPLPEEMTDVETGYRFSGNKIRTGINLYYMNYKNQLILTGKINDVGEYTRQNTPKSYRSGIELEVAWSIFKTLNVSANLTWSQNKIDTFKEFIDSSDEVTSYPQHVIIHKNTEIAFAPSVISAAVISWSPFKNFTCEWAAKYAGSQYLDNTTNEKRKLDPYFLNDIRLNYHVVTKLFKDFELKLAVNNLFSVNYESNGYTYSYYYKSDFYTQNYYYPQAGRNFLAGVCVKF